MILLICDSYLSEGGGRTEILKSNLIRIISGVLGVGIFGTKGFTTCTLTAKENVTARPQHEAIK